MLLRRGVLIRRGTQAGGGAVLGAVVVDRTRRFHALALVRILGNTEALAHAVHTALERALRSKSSLATLGASETILAHARAVCATTVATALAVSRARLECAARASETSLAHAGPVLCSTVSATHGRLTVHASPSGSALAGTFNAGAVLAAHLGPARRLAAVGGAETLGALALAGHALAIATAVLRALEVSAGRASEVGSADAVAVFTAAAVCRASALVGTDLRAAVLAHEARRALAAHLRAEALVQVIGAHLGAACFQVIVADRASVSGRADASAVVEVAHTVAGAVVLAERPLAAQTGEALKASAVAISASALAVAVLGVFARTLVAQLTGEADRALAGAVIARSVVATRLRAGLA